MRYHHMPITKKTKVTNIGEDVKKMEHWYIGSRNVNWCNHHEEKYKSSSQH